MADADLQSLSGDPVVDEAMKRFQRCTEWESPFRQRFLEDIKFADADSDNQWQWPNEIRRTREIDRKPCLTINVLRQHNLMIINEGKQNKFGITVRAVGNGATQESANVLKGIFRHIEYQSRAQDAYSTAREFQVKGGIGWWRIVTDYVSGDTFDQEIYLRRMWDPLSVYLDPDIQEKDGSDANFAFVFDTIPKSEFEEAYPEYKDRATEAPLGVGAADNELIAKDHVRICEYFRRVQQPDRLISFIDETTGERKTVRESRLHKEMVRAIIDNPLTKWRHVMDTKVEWYLIVAERRVDQTIWPGSYIPLVRVIGEESVVDGIMDRKGHTRAMKDAQRMFNYNASAQVEFTALQGKTPWTGAAAAIEELETYWNSANITNHSYLPYKHVDDNGDPIPVQALPHRVEPPTASPAYQAGMDTAFNQLMMASGQWQNQMGMLGNERTGAAIQKRQDQGDTATFHFQDNFQSAIVNCGRQIIELIPKVYDTKRVIKILADDGVDQEVEIDPTARQAYLQTIDHNNQVVKRIFNPNLGRYEVQAGMGPAYGTRREETVQAMTLILTQNPALTNIIGDLLLNALDFEEAQEAAQRLKRMVPPQALGQGPSQQEAAMQQMITNLQGQLAKLLEREAVNRVKLVGKDQMRDIDVYKAETDRFKALADVLGVEPDGVKDVLEQLIGETLTTKITDVVRANREGLGEQSLETPVAEPEAPPVPGARKAPDGQWYVSDPTRAGKYLRVKAAANG